VQVEEENIRVTRASFGQGEVDLLEALCVRAMPATADRPPLVKHACSANGCVAAIDRGWWRAVRHEGEAGAIGVFVNDMDEPVTGIATWTAPRCLRDQGADHCRQRSLQAVESVESAESAGRSPGRLATSATRLCIADHSMVLLLSEDFIYPCLVLLCEVSTLIKCDQSLRC
jgi:hypothetical protein